MKQLLQYVRTGESKVAEVPVPRVGRGKVLVQVATSLVSAGTERMVVDFAEKSLIDKARSRPDLVRQTLDKASREGVLATYEAVQNRLEQPMALGYSCAGTVIEVGSAVSEFSVGDRVACAGGGYAVHAEVVAVPQNLVVKLPDATDFSSAAFTTLAAIALQGIRLADVKLGEVVAVIGLGLLGQLTVQMLKTAGCFVVGMDIQADRADLAKQLGANAVTISNEELDLYCRQFSGGHGADAVLITADTKSNQPIEIAGEISRRKGVVVAVGAVGMNIPRKVYYEKEIDFQISSSYGPGRYDTTYEEEGHDYPYAYVRWTQNRNMQAFVNMVAEEQIDVEPLISHRFPIADAAQAYEMITGKTGEPFLGVLVTYPEQTPLTRTIALDGRGYQQTALNGLMNRANRPKTPLQQSEQLRVGILGAGLFANATLLPAIAGKKQIKLINIASGKGVSARAAADRFKIENCTTDSSQLIVDDNINTVAILTRHSLHAKQVIAALNAGKNVFVEKPLCLDQAELWEIVAAYNAAENPQLFVGFNRRFAPYVMELKQQLQTIREPLMLHYRVNAGFIPSDHWLHDPVQGGGRLIGEGVHFIDLILHLANSEPVQVQTQVLPDNGRYQQDNFMTTITFADGSLGTITYVANGDKAFSKEMVEVFGGGLSARMDDFRVLTLRHNNTRINRKARLRQDKGHSAEWEHWVNYLTTGGANPMPFHDIVKTMDVTFAAELSLREGITVTLQEG